MPIPSIKCVSTSSGAERTFPSESIGARFTVLPARRVAPISPIHHAVAHIEVEIDRLGKPVIENLDICSTGRRLFRRNVDTCAENAALAPSGLTRTIERLTGPICAAALRYRSGAQRIGAVA
jgi:hypothetical protein